MNNVWAIILAAGASTRMGKQKMLLPYGRSTVIETVIENAKVAAGKNIVLVLGANRVEIEAITSKYEIKTVVNENYLEGMLSSVICGFRALPGEAGAALIFLGDQPQIQGAPAKELISVREQSSKGIIIPVYSGKRGHPALIDTKYRNAIEKLDPEQGLRSLYRKYSGDVLDWECGLPEILRDIDTPEDYTYELNQITNQK